MIDKPFLQLLDLAEKHDIALNVHHLLILDMIGQGVSPPSEADRLVAHLVKIGLVERVGKGKQSRIILSRGMYRYLGEPGTYTRYSGLDRETNKQLILKHIQGCGARGSSLAEFRQVLPQLTTDQVRHLVYELKEEDKVVLIGKSNASRWHLKI